MSQKEYSCSMHPEIVDSKPGKCPLCGMLLEPNLPSHQEEEAKSFREI